MDRSRAYARGVGVVRIRSGGEGPRRVGRASTNHFGNRHRDQRGRRQGNQGRTVPLALAVAPDGTRVYVANIRDDTVSVIRIATNKLAPRKIKTGDGPTAIAITRDSRRLYVANARDNTVSVVDTATSRLAAKAIEVGHRPTAIALTSDGQRAYIVHN